MFTLVLFLIAIYLIVTYRKPIIIIVGLSMVLFAVIKYLRRNNGKDVMQEEIFYKSESANANDQNKGKSNFDKKTCAKFKEYSVIVRAGDTSNNMNCDRYKFSARYAATKRMRNREIYIFPRDDIIKLIVESGYIEPIEYHKVEWDEPSEAQISYLRDINMYAQPTGLSWIDASALLTKYEEHDYVANPQLFEYATEMRIPVSYYSGKKLLYGRIFHDLQGVDQIAFFAYCIYRFLSKDSQANLNHSIYKNVMYDFAVEKVNDQKFLKSMENYEGSDLRFFGTSQYGGQGGSKNTIAYKEVVSYLKEKSVI